MTRLLYDPTYRPLTMLFDIDGRISTMGGRSHTLWCLGYPEAALRDANVSLAEARDLGHVGILFLALGSALLTHFLCGNYATTEALADELFTLADEQESLMWKSVGRGYRGYSFGANGRASEAVQLITAWLAVTRSSGSTHFTPLGLSLLGKAYAELGRHQDAWRAVNEAKEVIEKTGETLFEAHVYGIEGEIELKSPQPDVAKAEAQLERALAVARQQQAKSWELRAAMSLARLWRDQGKRDEARDLLGPIYRWFTEGFDTLDLKQADALLQELGG
jgi:predicted ATPase